MPTEKLLEMAKETMGRDVFEQELADRQSLMDELLERVPESKLTDIVAKISAKNPHGSNNIHHSAN